MEKKSSGKSLLALSALAILILCLSVATSMKIILWKPKMGCVRFVRLGKGCAYNPSASKYIQDAAQEKSRRGGPHSTLSILRREFPDGNFQSLFGGSSCIVPSSSSSNVAADPLLSSFISPIADGFFTSESCIFPETEPVKKTSNQSLSFRKEKRPSLSAEDHKQKVKRRSLFVSY